MPIFLLRVSLCQALLLSPFFAGPPPRNAHFFTGGGAVFTVGAPSSLWRARFRQDGTGEAHSVPYRTLYCLESVKKNGSCGSFSLKMIDRWRIDFLWLFISG